jgi:hypothetical protein
MPGNSLVSLRHISPEKLITGCILIKTIIKRRMPFFLSCIMDSGAILPLERAACGDTPLGRPHSPDIFASGSCPRGSSLVLQFAALRILTTSLRASQPAVTRSNSLLFHRLLLWLVNRAGFVGCYMGCFVEYFLEWELQFDRMRFWPPECELPNEPNPTIGQSASTTGLPACRLRVSPPTVSRLLCRTAIT